MNQAASGHKLRIHHPRFTPGRVKGETSAVEKGSTYDFNALSDALKRRSKSALPVVDARTTEILLRELGLENEEDLQRRIARLLCLIPDIRPRLSRLQPQLLASLLVDTGRAAYRMLELKSLFPSANVGSISARYPNLLLSPDWENVRRHRATLLQMLPEGADANRVVESVPLVLMLDLEQVGADLRRLIPGCDPGEVLASNPGIVLNAMNISHLSIW